MTNVKLKGVSKVMLGTTDLVRSVDFYVETLDRAMQSQNARGPCFLVMAGSR
tara:strand:+ start:770 stop:925 length:156 start_codon:yes stop_codon:yes gene_type:complete